ncbi:S-layer homology domain-containing protein [Anaerobacillus sp. HL2]|nr:S-layer homology domain-containing protein [Anaerobacillus sp. HL2]
MMLARGLDLDLENAPDHGFTDATQNWYKGIRCSKSRGLLLVMVMIHLNLMQLYLVLRQLKCSLAAYDFLEEDTETVLPFTDVEDKWYKGYVGAIFGAGITEGTSATTFSPNTNVLVDKQQLSFF